LNDVLLTTAFCIVGYEMKWYRDLKPWHTDSKIRDGAIFLILIAFLFVVSQYNGFISPADDWYGTNGWLYLISGIIGAVVIFMLSSISTSSMASRKMQFLGVNSQVIYEVHPIFFYLVPVLLGLFGLSTLDYDTSFALIWPIRFVLAFGLSIPFTLLVSRNRFLSLIFKGKSRE
jgi:fucose 4-O-acetylase-like acetyltransferase